ncbi:MAG: hypothetical protein QME32_06810, partial [Endomicrobiia bacterium]|nr:hypothetical protein [Endomicrobiia bacterium]
KKDGLWREGRMKNKSYKLDMGSDKWKVDGKIKLVGFTDSPGLGYLWIGGETCEATMNPWRAYLMAKAIIKAYEEGK